MLTGRDFALVNRKYVYPDASQKLTDTFTGVAGLLSNHAPDIGSLAAWRNASSTWTLDGSGNLINTPVLGAEEVTNGDNEAAVVTTSSVSRGTLAQSAEQAHAGSNSAKYVCNTTEVGVHIFNLGSADGAVFSRLSQWIYLPTGQFAGGIRMYDGTDGSWISGTVTANDAWTQIVAYRTPKGTNWSIYTGEQASENADGEYFYSDDISVKPLTTSELLAISNLGYSQGYFKADTTTIPAGAISGATGLWDAAKQNGIISVIDRTSGTGKLLHMVNGVWQAALINTAVTYAAGAHIHLLFDGTYAYFWYNNALVGTRQDISARTTIINNTHWGPFSTDPSSTISGVKGRSLSVGPLITVTGITKANPGVVTATGHGLVTNDLVYFTGLTEMTELNGAYRVATRINDDTFSIGTTAAYGSAETTGGACLKKVQ